MDFSNAFFLYYFLPVVLLVYYITPCDKRKIVALTASILFYTWGATWFITILLLSLFLDFWFASKSVESIVSKKKYLVASLILNIAPLIYYKMYYVSIHPNDAWLDYAIPIGLSMIFLQRIAYSIDIYKDEKLHLSSFLNYAFYHLFFPKLVTGPLTKLKDFRKQILDKAQDNIWDNLQIGLQRFAVGFIKKIILANTLAIYTIASFAHIGEISTFEAFITLFAFGVQLFFEVSAYADMAIGLAKMFGYSIPENFNNPYLSKSISEFWKSWFSTVSEWFKKYIFEALECKIPSPILRILIVFFIAFLFLGINSTLALFIGFHALIISLEKSVLSKFTETGNFILRHLYVSVILFISWIFLRSPSLDSVIAYFQNLIGKTSGTYALELENKFYLILCIGVFLIYWSKIPFISVKINELKQKSVYSFAVAIVFLFAVSYATTLVNNGYLFLKF